MNLTFQNRKAQTMNKKLEDWEVKVLQSENDRLKQRVEFLEKIIADDQREKLILEDKRIFGT